jgi:uncharacterized membrane protein HdeD (DUF308 family)
MLADGRLPKHKPTHKEQHMATNTPILNEVQKRSMWSLFMGVLTAALGILLIVYPFATGTVTTVFIGWTLVLAGAAGLILAFNSRTPGSFFARILLAALYGITGIVLVAFPFRGVESLTLVVGAFFVVRGVAALVAALRLRPIDGWGWLLADALVCAAAGVVILARWPSSSFWALGTLVGASILATGISRIALAATVRGTAERLAQKLA